MYFVIVSLFRYVVRYLGVTYFFSFVISFVLSLVMYFVCSFLLFVVCYLVLNWCLYFVMFLFRYFCPSLCMFYLCGCFVRSLFLSFFCYSALSFFL